MPQKVYDVVVKTGSYESQGETKGRYKNVGAVFKSDDGRPYMLLDRTFNPAGVPGQGDKESVLLSFFEPKDNQGQGGGGRQGTSPQQRARDQRAQQGGGGADPDFFDEDDIPPF